MDYEKDLKIDDASLDLECLDQASLFMKYAKISAEAKRNLEETKQILDIKKAEIDKSIRENPDKYKIEKVTEGSIQSAILSDLYYQNTYQDVIDAKYEADMAQNAVNAMIQRKDMLEQLIKLHGQSYFAGPNVPRDLSKERELKEKKADSKIATRLTRQK